MKLSVLSAIQSYHRFFVGIDSRQHSTPPVKYKYKNDDTFFFLSLSPFCSVSSAPRRQHLLSLPLFHSVSLLVGISLFAHCVIYVMHSFIQSDGRSRKFLRTQTNEAPNSEFHRTDNDTSTLCMKAQPPIICFIALSYLAQSRNCQFMSFGFDSVCVCMCLSYLVTSYASK